MSDKDDNKVVTLESHIMKRLDKTSYFKIIEAAEALRVRFLNQDRTLVVKDIVELARYSKYLANKGHTEAIRLSYKFLYDRYFKDRGL